MASDTFCYTPKIPEVESSNVKYCDSNNYLDIIKPGVGEMFQHYRDVERFVLQNVNCLVLHFKLEEINIPFLASQEVLTRRAMVGYLAVDD